MVSYLNKCQKEELISASKMMLKRWLEDIKLLALWKFLDLLFSNNPSQYLQFAFLATGFLSEKMWRKSVKWFFVFLLKNQY